MIIFSSIVFGSFSMLFNAEYEVPIVDTSSKAIFVLMPDGNTYKIHVDSGYDYNIGDNVVVGITMLQDPEYRDCWLIDDLKGGEF